MVAYHQKGVIMAWNNFYMVFAARGNPLVFLAAAFLAAAVVIPQAAVAHLLQGNRGPVNAFNYTEGLLPHLDEDCAYSFECRNTDVKDEFLYGCHYDLQSGECQCSRGGFSSCNSSKSSLAPAEVARLKGAGGLAFPLSLAGTVARPVEYVVGLFGSLPLAAKIAVGVIILVAVVSLVAKLRSALGNDLRKAKLLHAEATALHEQGQEEEAKLRFEKANYHREQAYEQQRI